MVSLKRVLETIKARHGFIVKEDMKWLIMHCPNRIVLVRCNLGRFVCKVCNLEVYLKQVEKEENNWVRDVSLPTTDPIWNT